MAMVDRRLIDQPLKCDWCKRPSVTSWREGRGTGHSESVNACEDHMQNQNHMDD